MPRSPECVAFQRAYVRFDDFITQNVLMGPMKVIHDVGFLVNGTIGVVDVVKGGIDAIKTTIRSVGTVLSVLRRLPGLLGTVFGVLNTALTSSRSPFIILLNQLSRIIDSLFNRKGVISRMLNVIMIPNKDAGDWLWGFQHILHAFFAQPLLKIDIAAGNIPSGSVGDALRSVPPAICNAGAIVIGGSRRLNAGHGHGRRLGLEHVFRRFVSLVDPIVAKLRVIYNALVPLRDLARDSAYRPV